MNKISAFFAAFFVILFSAGFYSINSGYNVTKPLSVRILPEILNEISGIAAIDTSTIACVQDESGTVFIYDYAKSAVTKQIPFSGPGDFEAVTVAGNTLYVLRSDGELFEIADYMNSKPGVKSHKTGIPARDNEGLCYDSHGNRLLIACKEGFLDEEVKNRQLIFSFDLKTKKLQKDPVISFDIKLLRKYLKDNKIKIGDDNDYDEVKLRTSEIAINPITGKLFLLSADDYLMLICDLTGKVESLQPLSRSKFRKAEGITFNRRGEMFISNEAEGKSATILRYRMIQ
jgi:uncharacterized protein YjiK